MSIHAQAPLCKPATLDAVVQAAQAGCMVWAVKSWAPAALTLALQGPALTYNPNHFQNNDPVWDLLNKTVVRTDRSKGEYNAAFPKSLREREGGRLAIPGFILPLEASSRSAHFMVVRRNTGCPFCPPNAPTEAVEVRSTSPITYTGEEVVASGRLRLVAKSADGLFFQLEDAILTKPSGRS